MLRPYKDTRLWPPSSDPAASLSMGKAINPTASALWGRRVCAAAAAASTLICTDLQGLPSSSLLMLKDDCSLGRALRSLQLLLVCGSRRLRCVRELDARRTELVRSIMLSFACSLDR